MNINPDNATYEQRLIGLLLINNENYIEKIEAVYTKIHAKYFQDKQLGIIFDALRSTRTNQGEQIDLIDLKTMLLTFPDFKGEYAGTEGKLTNDLGALINSAELLNQSYDSLIAVITQEYVTREIEKINLSNRTAEEKLKAISAIQEEYEKSMNDETDHACIADYMAEDFRKERLERKQASKISTGFMGLDNNLSNGLGLCPTRLHVIGAVSSAGKTTFALQIADNIAKDGTPVLYFSLEQSRYELVCKSLQRTQHELRKKYKNKVEISEKVIVEMTDDSELLNDLCDEYNATTAPNMYIYESNFNLNIDRLVAIVKRFIRTHDTKPVIIVDYLQILKPSDSLKYSSTAKEKVDDIINKLKMLAVSEKVAVLAISSFNRKAYTTKASMDDYKESGGIEYSADVLLALQYQGVGKEGFDFEKAKKGETVNGYDGVKKMQITSLKNRGGQTSFEFKMNFYPKYSYFEEE